MKQETKFVNAEIPVANKHEAEEAAKMAEELGYRYTNFPLEHYDQHKKYLSLYESGNYGYGSTRVYNTVIPLSEFLNQNRTETITLDNGEKWRVQLIEKVQEEPMSAEEFYHNKGGLGNKFRWMERYAQYRLEFERGRND